MLRFTNGLSDVQTEIASRNYQEWTNKEILHQFSCPNPEASEAMKISGLCP
jgi:hypothetical protein